MSHLRADSARPLSRDSYLTAGLAAIEQVFSINPNHALGRATQGALWLLRAQSLRDPVASRAAAQSAVTALEQAVRNDAFLSHDNAPLLAQAKALAAVQ